MSPNEHAQHAHQELFPEHISTLAVTDPELIETFDNFAFDEVLRQSHLDKRTTLMIQLAALIASQALREYRVMLGAALTVGVTPVEIKEIVYQAVPYNLSQQYLGTLNRFRLLTQPFWYSAIARVAASSQQSR